MVFRSIRYNTGTGIMKVRIEDDTGALMENWTIMMSDFEDWAETMRRKYGITKKKKKDLDWINY